MKNFICYRQVISLLVAFNGNYDGYVWRLRIRGETLFVSLCSILGWLRLEGIWKLLCVHEEIGLAAGQERIALGEV